MDAGADGRPRLASGGDRDRAGAWPALGEDPAPVVVPISTQAAARGLVVCLAVACPGPVLLFAAPTAGVIDLALGVSLGLTVAALSAADRALGARVLRGAAPWIVAVIGVVGTFANGVYVRGTLKGGPGVALEALISWATRSDGPLLALLLGILFADVALLARPGRDVRESMTASLVLGSIAFAALLVSKSMLAALMAPVAATLFVIAAMIPGLVLRLLLAAGDQLALRWSAPEDTRVLEPRAP